VRFPTVVELLARLPEDLPHGSRAIDPVLLGPPSGLPAWTRLDPSAARRAAGLVLLFPDDAGDTRIVLTERPDGMRHAGQVSLPGGKEDPGDEFPVGTALREAREEVGLDVHQAGVRVVGRLDEVDVRVSGFLLTPVIALAERPPVLVASPREVASVLVPLVDVFLPDAPVKVVEEDRGGYRIRYGGYPWEGHLIWGATARVLAQLGAILGGPEAVSGGLP
jgi:8-oxo-dGTP pyrophosphatase MutT (NUDIX family)